MSNGVRLTRRKSQADVLRHAIDGNDLAQIRFALKAGQNWRINEKDENGMTALQRSCVHGHIDIVRLLLDHGADMEVTDENGWTALHYGASGGHVEVVTLLLNSCANVAALATDGKLAIDVAKGEGMVFILASAILRSGKQTLLLRYLPCEEAASNASLMSLESADRSSNRFSATSTPHSSLSALSQEVFRASQQYLTERFGSYMDDMKSGSVDRGLPSGVAGRLSSGDTKLTRNTSCPVGTDQARAVDLGTDGAGKRRLNSFNSSFSPDVLERFAVSETNLNKVFDQFLHTENGSDINRFPNVSDLTQSVAESEVWIRLA